jgi:hypothetical protein
MPESGAYAGFSDAFFYGGETLIGPGGIRFRHGTDIEPDGKKDWGLALRWSPQWLDGTIGLYYRHFSDKLPQTQVNPVARTYFMEYADGIDLYGASFAKQILGVSVGAELNYRTNMPLVSDPVYSTVRPAEGETLGARGTTWHGLLNFLYVYTPPVPVFDTSSLSLEFSWNRWGHVSQGYRYFKGRTGYTDMDGVTDDFVGVGLVFSPTWFQVFPGMDLSAPLSYSTGLHGNSAVMLGGNEHAGSYSAGLSLDVYSKYKFDLKYVGYSGNFAQNPATGAVTTYNSPFALLSDRNWVTFTFKVTL